MICLAFYARYLFKDNSCIRLTGQVRSMDLATKAGAFFGAGVDLHGPNARHTDIYNLLCLPVVFCCFVWLHVHPELHPNDKNNYSSKHFKFVQRCRWHDHDIVTVIIR